jgi:hypothetical protein
MCSRQNVLFFLEDKGASGSWAEPYFACHLRCKWDFAYPPGILYRVFTGKKKNTGYLAVSCIDI